MVAAPGIEMMGEELVFSLLGRTVSSILGFTCNPLSNSR
jgi:hypothetical protein